ncbi:MAG TPA: hypothetical protein VLG93_02550 [Sulfuricaulis sp.]|nr:hypothetical protein [Sulfuricaulis sp.]
MDKVRLLCAMDGRMMQEFSARTIRRLEDHALFRLLLPVFRSFFEINVRKEIEKDRLAILRAANAQRAGGTPGAADVEALLQQARDIDQRFLREAAVFPVNIHIEYRDIEQFRRRRIEMLLAAAHAIFSRWEVTPRFRAAVAAQYTHAEFEALLREIMQLYGAETRALSRSVRIPSLFNLARDSITDTVNSVMTGVAADLAGELARQVYRRAR